MHIFGYKNIISVFLWILQHAMKYLSSVKNTLFLFTLVFCLFFPFNEGLLFAQAGEAIQADFLVFNKLRISSVENIQDSNVFTEAVNLEIAPLSALENEFADNLKSQWVWADNTLEMIDTYSPFLFRTKKSAKLEEVKVLLSVNEFGRLVGFELLEANDKGLKERLDYMIRKMPDCKPVPGFKNYQPETFKLIISK